MLGYDRHWNRYWLLEGSCPEAVTSEDSPASAWVYVERCQAPPGQQGQRHPRESSNDEEEELSLGQLAQEAQRAKRRKVQIPDDQAKAASWGCYKSAEQVGKLINYLNYRGVSVSLMSTVTFVGLLACVHNKLAHRCICMLS